MPAIAARFCALAGLPVSRADLCAHVIFPSLPIRVPRTLLVIRLPVPSSRLALCLCASSLTVHTVSRPALAVLPPFSVTPSMSPGAFCLHHATHPARAALTQSPHLRIYYFRCAVL
ncbi:hypothetical protein DFH08DRAFT_966172 [Mycena albidolilacea]|uniref:Uncharacterized protein n=1 Tax=Mycena albidolilacea TaxID=1033008 RepID=A0AAD7ELQ9_9AGAR|nr:hypothetical protein DFH08DRAFT_966172 [Mycena albidolilacea]